MTDFFDSPPPGAKPPFHYAGVDPAAPAADQTVVATVSQDPVGDLVNPMAAIVAKLQIDPGRALFDPVHVQLVRDDKSKLTAEQRLYLLETIPKFPEADRTELELRQLQDSDLMEVAFWTWDEADRNALAALVKAEEDAAKEAAQ